MISLTHQERKVLFFLCLLLALGLFLTQFRKATGCSSCLVDVYGGREDVALVDLNQATFPELIAVPGIGEKTAEAILKVRSLKGRFSSLDELTQIKGINAKKLDILNKYLYVK
ncbi:MAG: helix-hairpin-helix domain-containing protein [Candidatus Omnitrophota bacterium]